MPAFFIHFLKERHSCRNAVRLGLLVLCIAGNATADILHLTNGGKLEGRITKEKNGYRIVTGTTESLVPFDRVSRLEKKSLPEEEYLERLSEVGDDDVMGHYVLGLWCKESRLREKATMHFQTVLRLEPDHEGARRALGFIQDGKEWVTREEYMRRQGKVIYKGQWVEIEQAERLQAEEAHAKEIQTLFEKAWPSILAFQRKPDRTTREKLAAGLAKYGEAAIPLLKKISMENSSQLRRLSIETADMIPGHEAMALLTEQLMCEGQSSLIRLAAEGIAARTDRNRTTAYLISCIMQSGDRDRDIIRAVYVLGVMGDANVIPKLIENVGYSPNEITPISRPAESAKVEGPTSGFGGGAMELSSSLDNKPATQGKRYPAHLALQLLTGMELPPNQKTWEEWWDRDGHLIKLGENRALLRKERIGGMRPEDGLNLPGDDVDN